jgi:tetratricopeptide (TPR) repeat protein
MTSEPLAQAIKRGRDLHQARQLDQALVWYRTALAVAPDDAEANSLTGLALVHAGRAEEGAPYLRRAVELDPHELSFRFNQVQGLRALGDYAGALAELGVILRRDPANARAWERAGDVARQQKDDYGAAAAWDRARRLQPATTDPALKLAGLALSRSRYAEALSALDPIADRAAQQEDIYRLWCLALIGLGDWRALSDTATSWARSHPGTAEAWRYLARGAFEQGRHRAAADAFAKSLELQPPSVADLAMYAELCLTARDFSAAEAVLVRAEAMGPENPEVLSNLALARLYRGRLEEAEAICRRCLAADPDHMPAYKLLSRLRHGQLPAADRAAVTRIAGQHGETLDRRISAAFAVAHAHEAEGDTDAAFTALAQAHALCLDRNELEGRRYDREQEEAIERRLIERFPARPVDSSRMRSGSRPIFVVGMPRSGSTLIEGVLGAHSRVFACGERPAMRKILRAWLELDAAGTAPDEPLLEKWATGYLDGLPALGGADHVTDKQPLNFEAVGLIARLFPDAVVIHVQRDPLETCLSVYRQEFSRLLTFAHRLSDIGHYYGRYRRLMAHWEHCLPGRVTTMRYETFVRDYASSAQALVTACGLDWEPQCLEFQRSPRPITTLSAAQARGPVATATGRAQRYRPYLGELTGVLSQWQTAGQAER